MFNVLLVSGNANNGTNAGLLNANTNNEATDTNTNIGTQLNAKIKNEHKPYLLVKNIKIKSCVGSQKRMLNENLHESMKRINNIFDNICSLDNLILADKKARKGKGKSKEIKKFDEHKEELLLKLQNDLINGNFKTSKYKIFTLNEYGKERVIYKLPYYPDRIVHHAIMNITESIWCNLFVRNTFSCIKGRGIHDGLKRLKTDLQNNVEETKYCLKLDIRKFYPSIDHQILKDIIRYKIKDKQVLILLDEIIDSAEGVPIGNYLSQYFANLYLAYFDHWVKEVLKVKYYYRYADDIVILYENKPQLQEWLKQIKEYLNNNLNLIVKHNHQIFETDVRGIDFLGYVIRHKYILLRKSIKRRLFKRISKNNHNLIKSIASYNGWLKYCDSFNLKNKIKLSMAKKFSELNIAVPIDIYIGEKISINKVLNKEILVKQYSVSKSKFENKDCLTLQIVVDEQDRIIFTSSKYLMKQLESVKPEDLPFETKIETINKNGYVFK